MKSALSECLTPVCVVVVILGIVTGICFIVAKNLDKGIDERMSYIEKGLVETIVRVPYSSIDKVVWVTPDQAYKIARMNARYNDISSEVEEVLGSE